MSVHTEQCKAVTQPIGAGSLREFNRLLRRDNRIIDAMNQNKWGSQLLNEFRRRKSIETAPQIRRHLTGYGVL